MSNLTGNRSIRGMTLVELLVVVGVISILAALLIGGVSKAHAYAKDRTWRLEAHNYYHYIRERLIGFYQGEKHYPALSATDLHQRGVFDGRVMDFLNCPHVEFVPFAAADGDDKVVLKIDDYWIRGIASLPGRAGELILTKKMATQRDASN